MKWNLVLHNQPQLFGLFYDRVMQVSCFTLVHPSEKKKCAELLIDVIYPG